MENIGLDLYINAFIVGVFETISFIVADSFIMVLPRKKSVLIGITISCALSFLFIVLRPPTDCGTLCTITVLQILMAGVNN